MLRRRTFIGSALGAADVSALPKSAFAHIMSSFQLYDTHAHFYTDDVANYPIDGSTARYGVEEVTARIIANPKTPEVIFDSWSDGNVAKGVAVQYGSAYLYDNSYIIDISKKYPERITPVVILDDHDPATAAAVERMTKEDKISGIRFRGFAPEGETMHYFLSDEVAEIWQTANQLGIAIVLMPHTRGDTRGAVLARMAELAVKYPNVNLILDHMAFPKPVAGEERFGFYPEHLELAKLPNVYYKYTNLLIEQLRGCKVELQPFVEYSAELFGTDKIVWGSDYGNTAGRMVDLVHDALESAKGLPLAQQKEMFFDTADRIHVPGGRGAA